MLREIANRIPDLLTLLRVFLALILFGVGLEGTPRPERDIWLLVLAWTSDMVDGQIWRALKVGHSSWLGKNDVYVDMLVSLSALFYMTVTSLLPLWLVLIYLAVWGVLFLRSGIPPLYAQVFQNPIYLAFIYFAVQADPQVLAWLLLWALVGLLLFWRRVVQLFNDTVRTLRP